MLNTAKRSPSLRVLLDIGLVALTVTFGLQVFRLFLPTVLNYYGVQPGVTFTMVGMAALGVFALGLLSPVVHRLLRPRLMMIVTAGGIGLLRLIMQFGTPPPVTFALSATASVLFLWFIPLAIAQARTGGPTSTNRFAVAFLCGLALDTALNGAAGTYDLGWQRSLLPLIMTVALFVAQIALLVRSWRQPAQDSSDAPFVPSLVLLGIGPILVLEELVYQNVASFAVMSGWQQPLALAWIILANAAAIAIAAAAPKLSPRWPWMSAIDGLVLMVLVATPQRGGLAALWLLLALVELADALSAIMIAAGTVQKRRGFWRSGLAVGLSMFLFALLLFLYYIVYDVRMPYQNSGILILCAVIVLLASVAATYLAEHREGPSKDVSWAPALAVLCLLVIPIVVGLAWTQPKAVAGKGWPIRVMTYNLHYGFDTDGYLGMEALARIIEQAGKPDLIGLEEVNRGWYVSGSIDMLTWLSRRLNMPYIFAPASDAIWGNAILSRYPIAQWGYAPLPWHGEPLKRSYLWAQIDLGKGDYVLFFDTHLHQLEDGSAIRQEQVSALLQAWNKKPFSIIVGDTNSLATDPEMVMMRQAGLVDAFTVAGTGQGLTYISTGPYQRIDYVWVTPDIKPVDMANPPGNASDHLGVAVTVSK
jgi:endonuclease/exonuclease/phosphatase family metal-dependent hydrolase